MGQGNALVEPEQVRGTLVVLDGYRHVAEQRGEFLRQPVKRFSNHRLESLGLDIDHASILPRPEIGRGAQTW